MRTHLIIAGLLLIILSLALAQDNPKRIDPIPPVKPILEERKEAVKPELKPPLQVTPILESQPTPEKDRLEPASKVSPIAEEGKRVDKSVFGPMPEVTPVPERGLNLERLDLKGISPVSGSQEISPEYTSWGLKQPPQISGFQEPPLQYSPVALKGINPVQGMDGMNYQVQEFNDFSGGWNISTHKTKLAPNEALDLENALWNPGKEMYKRPGYSEHSTPPFIPNFLYRYYQQDGDKWTMGGSDTSLHFWHEDSSGDGWTYLIGTEGTSGRWDGTTFNDLFVGTHEGIEPVVWDGESFFTLGVSTDSFQIQMAYSLLSYPDESQCYQESVEVKFVESEGWKTNEWVGYFLGLWADNAAGAHGAVYDTCNVKVLWYQTLILGNDDQSIYIRPPQLAFHYDIQLNTYARIYSWFGIDSVWREGQLDSASDVCDGVSSTWSMARLFDDDFYWDSTFNYKEYIFEVTGGTGSGKENFLWNHPCELCASQWDTTAFLIWGYDNPCFDSTTTYRIYRPAPLTVGAKFTEVYDAHLWLGWTGIGTEQNKNRVIYSALNDLGNWPPENNIWIESDDGDFITGMIAFEPEGTYRQTPESELLVSKNQSFYRVFPYIIAGELDYKTIRISSGVGCCSNAGMANVEGRFILFPDQHGVYAYDGKVSDRPISAKIDPIFEAWDTENLEDASAVYNPQDRHYYLSYPGLYDIEYSGDEFIAVFEMDSAQGKDGYWTHNFDSSGNEIGSDNWEFYESAGGYVDIAAKSDGEYAIMFKKSSGATGFKVFLAFFDGDGDQIGDTLRIDADSNLAYANNDDHKLDMNSAGQIIACWTDKSDGNNDIRCQCVDFDTGLVGGNFFVNSDSSGNSYDYVSWGVGMNEAGVCVIAWQDWREYTACLTEIYAQRFQYPDIKLGNNFRVNNCWEWDEEGEKCDTCITGCGPIVNCAWNENKPAVGVSSNTFVVTWMSTHCTGQTCLYKRAFNINGVAREDEVLLSDCAGGNVQEPSISMNSRGNYVIAYDKECTEDDYAIYLMAFNSGDTVRLSETQVSDTDSGTQGPDVSINNLNIMTVVWYDARDPAIQIAYRSYGWNGALMASDSILSSSAYCGYPEIDCFLSPPDTGTYTLAWNIDHHGWSKESFVASAYCYQHSIFDEVKILFANPEDTFVYNYGTQADDISDPVILTYQSPYIGFSQYPSFGYQMRFATLEASLDAGTVYLDWYKDYGDLTYQDSIVCGVDCREEMALPDTLRGKNISMKLTTGSETNDFTLSKFWWEGVLEPNRR